MEEQGYIDSQRVDQQLGTINKGKKNNSNGREKEAEEKLNPAGKGVGYKG